MSWNEKPPMLTGQVSRDLANLRDYLFRMAGALTSVEEAVTVTYDKDGKQILSPAGAAEEAIAQVKQNARELRSLIIKTADTIEAEMDAREEEYNGRYLAISQFGTFEENLDARIATNARGVVESYGYNATISSMQDVLDLYQGYFTQINGEIRRGLVEDPDHPGSYVIGIVISQECEFSTAAISHDDPNYPGDGQEYWYVEPNQTFGLYTSTGWQFWINGVKRAWLSSEDSMLHVSNIVVEESLIGGNWKMTFSGGFGLKYVGD